MAKTPQTRKEATSVRLEPKIKYLVEIAARIQRRSVTNYIEWALEESLKSIDISLDDNKSNLFDFSDRIWNTDEASRFAVLAENFPELLTFDEQRIIDNIRSSFAHVFLLDPENPTIKNNIRIPALRGNWELITACLDGSELGERAWEKLLAKEFIETEKYQNKTLDMEAFTNSVKAAQEELRDSSIEEEEKKSLKILIDDVLETLKEFDELKATPPSEK